MAKKKANSIILERGKLFAIYILINLFFIVLVGRLYFVMVADGKELKEKAAKQWTNDTEIKATRGSILDRNGNKLAINGDVYRIDLDLKTLKETLETKKWTIDDLSTKLAAILNMDESQVKGILNLKGKNGLPLLSATLKRGVDKDATDKIKTLSLRGIIISSDTKRYYVNGDFLSQVLGRTNDLGVGISGVEKNYNSVLAGKDGAKVNEKDSKGNMLPYDDSEYTAPVNGKDVVLTIDGNIQTYVEKAAEQALKDNKAKSVTITVMNPKNGEILAMTSKPDLDPNAPITLSGQELQDAMENKAVEWTFEPGSIFKAITAETALEEGTQKETDTFVCNGSYKVAGKTINCWETSGHGTETFVDILKNSCNVGFMQVGLKLGKDNLYKHINIDKFGEKTGIDLPGESPGILKPIDKVGPVDLATISFGQAIATTQVQYLAAFNAIANGGDWIRPHVMKEIAHEDENNKLVIEDKYSNYGKTKIMDPNVVSTLRGYLEQVVSKGVGINAHIDGYDIAGKTGTAQWADPATGGYSPGKYVSSFAGMAPYEDPKITMLISINQPDPSKYYAGQTAAPVAKQLFEQIIPYITTQNVLDK
ncbi:MAG: stage V sporulation protein D [Bacillota bacterium]|nr:stage V sporulation protein D [Bacillota bacterium]